MKMEFNITKMVEEIVMQAQENQEEFIIETIYPYCENILQIKINKEELKQILLNGMQKQQPCEDCISREAVLDVLKDKWNMFSDANDAMQESINTIEALPSVQPKKEA